MTLTPQTAAKLADGVYGIRTTDNVAQGFLDRGVRGLDEGWDIAGGSVATGISGAIVRPQSGFAVVLNGVGARSAEKAIAVRGTVTQYDWLTNFSVSVDPGPLGLGVHAGFNRVYRGIIDQIVAALNRHVGKIHIVGHSLGGAIANNVAARLHSDGHTDLELYTFGAPRVGLPGYTRALTQALGAENIYRVYHLSDPVPMIPIYPFQHAPTQMDGIRVGGSQARIWHTYHFMDSYEPLVRGAAWRSLKAASLGYNNLRSVSYWLDKAGEYVSIPGASMALWALGKALQGILTLAGRILGVTVLGAATAIDTVAYLIHEAARLSKEIGEKLVRLMELVCKWLGRTMVSTAQITAAFLSYVLSLLVRPLAAIARLALTSIE